MDLKLVGLSLTSTSTVVIDRSVHTDYTCRSEKCRGVRRDVLNAVWWSSVRRTVDMVGRFGGCRSGLMSLRIPVRKTFLSSIQRM